MHRVLIVRPTRLQPHRRCISSHMCGGVGGGRLVVGPSPQSPQRSIRTAAWWRDLSSHRESALWSEERWVGLRTGQSAFRRCCFAAVGLFGVAATYQATIATRSSPTSCSPNMNDVASDKESTLLDPEEEGEDIYANLPEEDEETTCSMCNTFRQGPCRPEWRKLERCFHDNEKTNNVAVKCMRYFRPHQECLMKYSNLYQLISLDMKQDIVDDTERAIAKHEKRVWDPPIQWDNWASFVRDAGVNYRQTLRYPAGKRPKALWKRLPENTEPVLLELTASLPRRDEEKGLILKLAYALDQDGMTVGLSFNKEYGDLLEGHKNRTSNAGDGSVAAESTAETEGSLLASASSKESPFFELEFYVLPGESKSIRIFGLYAENPLTADPAREVLDALLYEGKKHSLKKVLAQSKSQ